MVRKPRKPAGVRRARTRKALFLKSQRLVRSAPRRTEKFGQTLANVPKMRIVPKVTWDTSAKKLRDKVQVTPSYQAHRRIVLEAWAQGLHAGKRSRAAGSTVPEARQKTAKLKAAHAAVRFNVPYADKIYANTSRKDRHTALRIAKRQLGMTRAPGHTGRVRESFTNITNNQGRLRDYFRVYTNIPTVRRAIIERETSAITKRAWKMRKKLYGPSGRHAY